MQIQDGAFELVLFDLDGTLLDTAPDMVASLHELQRAHGLTEIDYNEARNYVSNGAHGLVSFGFPKAEEDEHSDLVDNYLEIYAERLSELTVLFPGLDALLTRLEDADCPWGIVTNKPEYLTNPLVEALGLAARSICTVSGDTLPVRKPEPAPLLLAADIANVVPERTLYIGDAERDIQAGRRAGMATIAAGYGYITDDDDPREWDPDIIATTVVELVEIVARAVDLDDE